MGRGQALKTKVKTEKRLTKARLQAKKEWDERKSNIPYKLKHFFVKALERVDPLEGAACLGITVIVKALIDESEEIRAAIKPFWVLNPKSVGEIEDTEQYYWSGIPFWYIKKETGVDIEGFFPEYMDWIIAFGIAFIVVRHPEVITTMFQGATSLTGFILGLLK